MPEVNYVWDPIEDNVIRERDENGNVLADYTTRPTLYGSVLSQDRGGQVRHYHFDGQGNTTELTDENGNVTDTRRYSAFGLVTESSGITEFSWQWRGNRGIAADTRTYIFRLWPYEATVGRAMAKSNWVYSVGDNPEDPTSEDPLGPPGGNVLGTFNLLSASCQPGQFGPGCCCTDFSVVYFPTNLEKAIYDWICVFQQVQSFLIRHCGKVEDPLGHNNKWHPDMPLGKQECWTKPGVKAMPPKPYKAVVNNPVMLDDLPGRRDPPCHDIFGFSTCPSCDAITGIVQNFEACAVGALPSGGRIVIGCIRFRHKCNWSWSGIPATAYCDIPTTTCCPTCTRTASPGAVSVPKGRPYLKWNPDDWQESGW